MFLREDVLLSASGETNALSMKFQLLQHRSLVQTIQRSMACGGGLAMFNISQMKTVRSELSL